MIYRFVYNVVTMVLDTVLAPLSQFLYWITYHQHYRSSKGNWYIMIAATCAGNNAKDCDGYRLRFVLNPSRMKEPRILFPKAKYQKCYKEAFTWFHLYLEKAWGDPFTGLYCTKSGDSLFYIRLKQIRLRVIYGWLIYYVLVFVTIVGGFWWFRITWFIKLQEYVNGNTLLQGTATLACYSLGVMVIISIFDYYKKYRKHTDTLQTTFNSTAKNLSQDHRWYYSIH